MDIKPIKSDRDYRRVLAEVERLMDARPNTAEGDRLDLLTTLVEAWEARHHAIDAPDPIAAIEFALEQRGLERKHLTPMLGSRGRVSEIMNRKRSLTLPMIRRLRAQLGISADVLVGSA